MTKTFLLTVRVSLHEGKFTSVYLENVKDMATDDELNADDFFGVGVNTTDNKAVISNRSREE